MESLMRAMSRNPGGPNGVAEEPYDTCETVQISSLALLKMLLHGRAGVPLEVMGLMVGEQVDRFTIRVSDVFSIPQTATGQSVEAVDPEYQVQMLDKLKVVGRNEHVVGWYHSHPGFGCWLSGEDVNTASGYEQLTARSVSVVIDPIQSVRGSVVIDAFRTIPRESLIMSRGRAVEARQTTSNVGFLSKPSAMAINRGLDQTYYNLPISYRKKNHELSLLMNVYKRNWQEGFKLDFLDPNNQHVISEKIRNLKTLATQAEKFITTGEDEDDIGNIGRLNAMTHLKHEAEDLLSDNLNQSIGAMINALTF